MSPPSIPVSLLRFGAFEADLRSGELRKSGIRIKLQEQPFQVLRLLLQNPGRLVTREEIRQELWPDDTFVDFDHSLSNAVNRLRGALRDSTEVPRFIETVPRKGYRFLAPVDPVADGVPSSWQGPSAWAQSRRKALWAATGLILALAAGGLLYTGRLLQPSEVAPQRIMLAVLPLDNLSTDSAQDYFSRGMTEEIITQLAQFDPEHLGVIGCSSAERFCTGDNRFPEIAKDLQVEYVLEGSARRAGDRVRINLKLIRVRDRSHAWAQTYEGNMADVLSLQAQVATSVAREIRETLGHSSQSSLTPRRGSTPEAYDLYLKARYAAVQGDLEGNESYLKEAIAKDPSYALAYAKLADLYTETELTTLAPPKLARENCAKALQAATRAVELEETLADGHQALAWTRMRCYWDWSQVESHYRRALALNPHDALSRHGYATYLQFRGLSDEAIAEMRRAAVLDPYPSWLRQQLGAALYHARRYHEAIAQLKLTVEGSPRNAFALQRLGDSYLWTGQFHQAIDTYRRMREVTGENRPMTGHAIGGVARVYAHIGDRQKALSALAELDRLSAQVHVSPFHYSLVYAELGDRGRALDMLERAYEVRDDRLVLIGLERSLDSLRDDPRFKYLLRGVGLSP